MVSSYGVAMMITRKLNVNMRTTRSARTHFYFMYILLGATTCEYMDKTL